MAELPVLQNSTGNPQTDETLRGLIGLAELAFPGLIKAYYVEGSYSNRHEVSTSDLDMVFMLKQPVTKALDDQSDYFYECCVRTLRVELDLGVHHDGDFHPINAALLKLSGLFLYGEDVRDNIALPTPQEYGRLTMHNAAGFMCRIRQWPEFLTVPLAYPDPAGEFYSYDGRQLRLPDGSTVASSKDMVVMSGWAATGLLGYQKGQIVVRKSEYIKVYRDLINDEWTELLSQIYENCRESWHYLLPTSSEERAELRELCRQTLAFENHFLTLYQQVLLDDLRRLQTEPLFDRLRLAKRAGYIIYPDDKILQALQPLQNLYEEDFQKAVSASLARLEQLKADNLELTVS